MRILTATELALLLLVKSLKNKPVSKKNSDKRSDMPNKTLTIIRGIPGSGKSTLVISMVEKLCSQLSVLHYEADQFFVNAAGEYVFDIKKLGQAHEQCLSNTKKALELDSVNIIVSNTFTTYQELKPYLSLKCDRIVIIECVDNYGSVHNVPIETQDRMCRRWTPNNVLEAAYHTHNIKWITHENC